MYRLTETHQLYGLAGLVYSATELKGVPYNDKDLFELVFDKESYAYILVDINAIEIPYLTFNHHELLAIIMRYMEPANKKFVKGLSVTGFTSGINSQTLFAGMQALSDIYPFTGGLVPGFVITKYKFELEID